MSIRSKVRNFLARKLGVPEIPTALERLLKNGFQANTVFDVGAYQGDFARTCLHLWPRARVFCFEALSHKLQELKLLAERHHNVVVVPGLVGANARDNIPLHEVETASSVLSEHVAQDFPVSYHAMRTLDELALLHNNNAAPDLLKIDVQGYELEVLKGAEQILPGIQVILAEINLLDIHQNAALLADTIAWLHQRDWMAYDICGLTRRPLDGALWQSDMIFVPRDSTLRRDKRWQA